MANFHTRTIALHSATCRNCGQTYQSTNADHVADWIIGHEQTPCVPRSVIAVPDRQWDD